MKRCYREALSDEEALEMVEEGAGSHFDPDLVSLFVRHADEFIAMREQVNKGKHRVGL
jgi:putative two-component system response regulator